MEDPSDSLSGYVHCALAVQGYDFSEERVAEITAQFARIESIARSIQPKESPGVAGSGANPAPVFRP